MIPLLLKPWLSVIAVPATVRSLESSKAMKNLALTRKLFVVYKTDLRSRRYVYGVKVQQAGKASDLVIISPYRYRESAAARILAVHLLPNNLGKPLNGYDVSAAYSRVVRVVASDYNHGTAALANKLPGVFVRCDKPKDGITAHRLDVSEIIEEKE